MAFVAVCLLGLLSAWLGNHDEFGLPDAATLVVYWILMGTILAASLGSLTELNRAVSGTTAAIVLPPLLICGGWACKFIVVLALAN